MAIGLWAVARAVVSTTWRDPVVAGGLNAGGLIAVAIAIGCTVTLVVLTVRGRGPAPDGEPGEPGDSRVELAWPDAETRPRI